jgi:hypothetical protein
VVFKCKKLIRSKIFLLFTVWQYIYRVIDLAVQAGINSYKETINYNELQILTINYIQLEILCAGIEELVGRQDSWRYFWR